ncbi:MAG: polysaccharide deacetylase family protein [Pseudomonadota bacterium]
MKPLRLVSAAFALLGAILALTPALAADKRIALTFDDIPRGAGAFLSRDERARMLRAALREAGVEQAAFFVNPGYLTRRPEGVAHIEGYVADGHVIANHTANHPRLSKVPLADFLEDLDEAALWLKGRKGYRPWFRFPYLDEGRADKALRDGARAALAKRGLVNGYATVDASDWFYENAAREAVADGKPVNRASLRDLYVESHVEAAEFYDALAVKAVGYSPAHVMLLHETDLAALYIGDLVAALRAKGWTIITADQAYADPFAAFAATYDTRSAQGTLTEQVAWQAGLPAPRWYARKDTRLANAEFRNRVLGGERNDKE